MAAPFVPVGVKRKHTKAPPSQRRQIQDHGPQLIDEPRVRALVIGAVGAGATIDTAAAIAIASGFEIRAEMIRERKKQDPEFSDAINHAAAVSDSLVEMSLFTKATKGEDTTAMIFWLKNRRPQFWRDRKELEVAITDIPGRLRSAAEAARQRKQMLLAAVRGDDAITVEPIPEGAMVPYKPTNGNGNGNGHG